jgi:hypothetical protein
VLKNESSPNASGGDMRTREFAYADVFRHPPVEGNLFSERGNLIRADLPPEVAVCVKNESNCTVFLRDGTWFTTWGQGRAEGHPEEQIVFATSTDMGASWTKPRVIVRSEPAREERNSYGIPFVVPETDRIYLFFFVTALTDGKTWAAERRHDARTRRHPEHGSGILHFVFSDDAGATWSPRHPIPLPARDINVIPDRVHGWVNHPPTLMPNGEVMLTFSGMRPNQRCWRLSAAETYVLHCVNLLTEQDPDKLQFTLYPDSPNGIRCNIAATWNNPALHRLADFYQGVPEDVGWNTQELTLVGLEDGRWLGVARSVLGSPVYTVSEDCGRTWTRAERLRTRPGGEFIAHPMTMCPLARTTDGRIVLLFTNNDGSQRGAAHVWDGCGRTRNPQWIAVARQVPGEKENAGLVFGPPRILAEVDDSGPVNLKTGISMPQFFERDGRYFVMYNINKEHILLDEIPAATLDALTPGRA